MSEVTNDGIMSVRLECKYQLIRIILCYGPQEDANEEQRELFYDISKLRLREERSMVRVY